MKTLFTYSIALLCALFFSCKKAKKDVMDYFPAIKTVSAEITEVGDVIVTGEVDLSGDSVYIAGFCMDTLPMPDVTKNQTAFTPPDRTFSKLYKGLSSKKTYYFRTFAGNGYGYGYGNVISLSNIKRPPGTAVPPPCNMAAGTLDLGWPSPKLMTAFTPTFVANSTALKATFKIDNVPFLLTMSFETSPANNVYITEAGGGSKPGCRLYIKNEGAPDLGYAQAGSNIHVETLSEHSFQVAFCSIPWQGRPISGKFIVQY